MVDSFLVIGTGSIGLRHISCLEDLGVKNIYIAEPNDDNRTWAQRNFNIKQSFSTINDALEQKYDVRRLVLPAAILLKVAQKDYVNAIVKHLKRH